MSEKNENPITMDTDEIIEGLKPGERVDHNGVILYNNSHQPPAPVVDPSAATPVSLLSQALAQGLDPDTLEKFMDLQERYEANEARKAFADAMAKAQAKMQPIVAKAENDHTSSYYAKLGTIAKQITPVYGRYGLSVSFGMGKAEKEGELRTTARVLHKAGHYEDHHIDLPPDDVGSGGNKNKTAIHARISSNTYGKRAILMGIFNLSILSEDDDGNAAGGGGANRITDEEAISLQTRIDEAGLMGSALLREFGVDTWAELPTKKLEKASKRIEQLIIARSKT